MKRANEIAGLVLRICGSIALLAVSLLALQTRENEDLLVNDSHSVAVHAVSLEQAGGEAIGEWHKAAVEVNRPCKGKSCGTLALTEKLLTKGGDILVTTQRNEDREAKLLNEEVPGLMARVNMVVDQAGGTLAAYQKTGEALTAAAQGLQPVEDNAALALAQLDNVIADPDIRATAKNLASATAHGDAILGDAQIEADKIAHPPKKKLGFWASVYAGAQVVHKLSPPLF